MKILYAASEALPFVASGGLADVAGSLPRAVNKLGHDCRIVLPLYGDIKQEMREKLTYVTHYFVDLSWRTQYCGLFTAEINGVTYYLLDNEYYFGRNGIYGFFDDAERFSFFSKAIVDMLPHISDEFKPDIIHCNDWQTALVPVYLNVYYRKYDLYRNIRTVFTIHNIAYQGRYGYDILGDVLGLPAETKNLLDHDGCLNFMKAAIESSDKVTTVSPTYAREILDPWFSHGLDPLLKARSFKLSGILNGIDTELYSSKNPDGIYKTFTTRSLTGKKVNKDELCKMAGLDADDSPLIGMVTRLAAHKGLDLVKFVFDEMIQDGNKFIILGSGERQFESFFTEMAAKYPGRVAAIIGFIPDTAKKIYAGSDLFLMPSQSEPCGLAQMVSLRDGTVPIVRETGGLSDSILDYGDPSGNVNGFTFKTYNAHDMLGAIRRATGLYHGNPELWKKLVKHALTCDFSWERSARDYASLYESLS